MPSPFAHLNNLELIAAYVEDALARKVGVDYFLAQAVEVRGLKRRATRALAVAWATRTTTET